MQGIRSLSTLREPLDGKCYAYSHSSRHMSGLEPIDDALQ